MQRTFGFLTLFIVSAASLMSNIDITAVNLILAPMSQALGLSMYKVQWVANIYLLIYSALIIAGGRFGDIFGDKKILAIGQVLFFVGSAFTGFASDLSFILIGRFIQGIAAALIMPNSIAIAFRLFPKEKHGFVAGITSSLIGIGIALGPLLGGILTQVSSWRLVFIINLPITAFLVISEFYMIPSQKTMVTLKEGMKEVDILGIITLSAFLFGAVGFINSITYGSIINTKSAVLFSLTIILFKLFVYCQKKSKTPLIHIDILTNKIVAYSAVLRFLYGIPIMAFVFFIPLYLQNDLHYKPSSAALMFLPFTIALIFLSPYVGKWVDKSGYIRPLLFGSILSILGFLGFVLISKPIFWYWILVLVFICGLGVSIVRPPMVAATIKEIPEKDIGLINSISSTLNNVGGAIGIALTTWSISYYSKSSFVNSISNALPSVMFIFITVFLCIIFIVLFLMRNISISREQANVQTDS